LTRRGYWLLAAVALLLLIAVALNVVLFNRARQYYLDLNAVRLNPLDLTAYPIAPVAPVDNPRIVVFGDSRAARWSIPVDADQFEVVNRGVEAETSAQAALRFAAHVTPLQPDLVIVQVGVNDLKTIPLFPERKAEIVAATKENIRQIVEQAAAAGARVVLTTIFPVGEFPLERRIFWSPDIEAAVQDVNDYLRSLANSEVTIWDAAATLSTAGRANAAYYADELHLNQAGYAVLNRELAPLLTPLLNSTEKLP
jgi:lysophospholipase L1-like esterase